jgi:hypothetical protein
MFYSERDHMERLEPISWACSHLGHDQGRSLREIQSSSSASVGKSITT